MLELFFKVFSGCFVKNRRAEGWNLIGVVFTG